MTQMISIHKYCPPKSLLVPYMIKLLDIYIEHKTSMIKLYLPILTFSFITFSYVSRYYYLKLFCDL